MSQDRLRLLSLHLWTTVTQPPTPSRNFQQEGTRHPSRDYTIPLLCTLRPAVYLPSLCALPLRAEEGAGRSDSEGTAREMQFACPLPALDSELRDA